MEPCDIWEEEERDEIVEKEEDPKLGSREEEETMDIPPLLLLLLSFPLRSLLSSSLFLLPTLEFVAVECAYHRADVPTGYRVFQNPVLGETIAFYFFLNSERCFLFGYFCRYSVQRTRMHRWYPFFHQQGRESGEKGSWDGARRGETREGEEEKEEEKKAVFFPLELYRRIFEEEERERVVAGIERNASLNGSRTKVSL